MEEAAGTKAPVADAVPVDVTNVQDVSRAEGAPHWFLRSAQAVTIRRWLVPK